MRFNQVLIALSRNCNAKRLTPITPISSSAGRGSGSGMFTSGRSSVVVQTFTFILTDLIDFEAEPIKIELESEEEAEKYGVKVASEMLKQMPDLGSRGMCVLIRDDSGKTVSIVPLDPVS